MKPSTPLDVMRSVSAVMLLALAGAVATAAAGATSTSTSTSTAALAGLAAQSPCGNPFVNHFGPWDYRSARKADREIVERRHFTMGIQTMTKPENTMMHDMAQDVAYTLNVFPNHHQALLVMEKLAQRHRQDPPPGSGHSIDCWYERAVRFTPNDAVVRLMFARHLARTQRQEAALAQIAVATELAQDNPITHYSIGLIHFELGRHEQALRQAHIAEKLGWPIDGLKQQLMAAGRWAERSP